MRYTTILATAIAAVVSLSCAGDADDPTAPTRNVRSLTMYAGDHQTGPAGAVLPVPIAVRATDAAGNPVRGVDIFYVVVGPLGGPDPVPAQSVTHGDGVASTTWTLGPEAGEKQVRACTNMFIDPGFCVTFSATITPGT